MDENEWAFSNEQEERIRAIVNEALRDALTPSYFLIGGKDPAWALRIINDQIRMALAIHETDKHLNKVVRPWWKRLMGRKS